MKFGKKSGTDVLTSSERSIVRLVSAIQFINILDFQMVMPLGADFARDLGIPASDIGWVTGAYTAAAFLSGIAGAALLNRVNRRLALAISLWGLVISTALGGLSTSYATLICARILAGFFGGPAVSLSYAVLADGVAEERRGQAMGIVSGIYSVAGIVGLPIGLKLAEWGSWRLPFFAIALVGVGLVLMVLRATRPMAANARDESDRVQQIAALTRGNRRSVGLAFAVTFIALFGNFLLVPSVAAYLQLNLGYPRSHLSLLYVTGGIVTFLTTRLVGRMTDRFGSARMILGATPCIVGVYYCLFVHYSPLVPVLLLFVLSGVCNSSRYVIVTTETSKVPPPDQRPGFMSLMSAAQALGQSLGAFGSSLILVDTGTDRPLLHMGRVACLASLLAAIVPVLLIRLRHMNHRRAKDQETIDALNATAAEQTGA